MCALAHTAGRACLAPLQMTGRAVWTGSSSVDLRMELQQAGQLQLSALFTFVARDALSGKPFAINSLQPQSAEVLRVCALTLRCNNGPRWPCIGRPALASTCLNACFWAARLPALSCPP